MEDVNVVSSWLSNTQYWLAPRSAAASRCLRYTDGKNLARNGSMDVTPPETPMS